MDWRLAFNPKHVAMFTRFMRDRFCRFCPSPRDKKVISEAQ